MYSCSNLSPRAARVAFPSCPAYISTGDFPACKTESQDARRDAGCNRRRTCKAAFFHHHLVEKGREMPGCAIQNVYCFFSFFLTCFFSSDVSPLGKSTALISQAENVSIHTFTLYCAGISSFICCINSALFPPLRKFYAADEARKSYHA